MLRRSDMLPLARSAGTAHGARPNALLNVSLQYAVGVLVLLHCHVQGPKQPLGGEIIHDQAVRQLDRLAGRWRHLSIQPEIENEFLGSSRDPAEIRVGGRKRRGVYGELLRNSSLSRRLRLSNRFS